MRPILRRNRMEQMHTIPTKMMEKQERNTLYSKALNRWGTASQLLMAVEEMAELIQAISHFNRPKKKLTITQIASEIADVQIMLEQMQYLFICEGLVEKLKEEKLKRLEQYLEEK